LFCLKYPRWWLLQFPLDVNIVCVL
jgi:hypothetical protein